MAGFNACLVISFYAIWDAVTDQGTDTPQAANCMANLKLIVIARGTWYTQGLDSERNDYLLSSL